MVGEGTIGTYQRIGSCSCTTHYYVFGLTFFHHIKSASALLGKHLSEPNRFRIENNVEPNIPAFCGSLFLVSGFTYTYYDMYVCQRHTHQMDGVQIWYNNNIFNHRFNIFFFSLLCGCVRCTVRITSMYFYLDKSHDIHFHFVNERTKKHNQNRHTHMLTGECWVGIIITTGILIKWFENTFVLCVAMCGIVCCLDVAKTDFLTSNGWIKILRAILLCMLKLVFYVCLCTLHSTTILYSCTV